jgi:SAM-dependent methyltransferase
VTRRAGDADAERFLPESHGALMTYEHVHRYALAASLLRRKRVLDLGAGAGYGSRLLRGAGARVVAVDLAGEAARRAAPAARASAQALPFRDGCFEAVVCFEMIEHVAEPERVVDEIARVLAPGGVALVSTPDRDLYTGRAGNRNPHHLRELSRDEFHALLAARFPALALYGQSIWAGSWLTRLDDAGRPADAGARRAAHAASLEADPRAPRAPWADPGDRGFPAPLYLVAICARAPAALDALLRRIGRDHLLHDPAQRVLGEHYAMAEALAQRDRDVASFAEHARNLDRLRAQADERVVKLEAHAANLEAHVASLERRVAELSDHAANLEERGDELEQHAAGLASLRADAAARIAELEAHAANLETLVREHAAHLANVEALRAAGDARVGGLEAHTANLETLVRERDAHVANLEALREAHAARIAGLEAHAANLEARLRERDAHVANLEALREAHAARTAGLEAHAANLEALLRVRDAQAANLESARIALEARALDLEAQLRERAEQLASAQAGAVELETRLRGAQRELERLRATVWLRAGKRLGAIE